jgi:hypothetical protein
MKATRICSVDGCQRARHARGWCITHYTRWWKTGDPSKVKQIFGDDERRFLSYVDASGGPDACHHWTGTMVNGYGQFSAKGKDLGAHRWILGHLRGEPLGPDEQALHHCDNPPCVNERHLYVGDHAQNMRDRTERDRAKNVLAESMAAKTHCPQGHAYDNANTYHPPNGGRDCRACRREADRAWRARRKRA